MVANNTPSVLVQELPSHDPDALEATLQQRLVLTRYNGWLYSFSGVSKTLTIDSKMPPNRRKPLKPDEPQSAAAPPTAHLSGTIPGSVEQDAEAEGGQDEEQKKGEGLGKAIEEAVEEEKEEETLLTFREYYS